MKNILTLVITVTVMAVAAFFVTNKVILPQFGPGGAQSTGDEHSTAETEPPKPGEGEVYLVEDLLVNPKGTSGKRYLSTSLGLEVGSEEAMEKLKARDLQVRDLLISVLSARTVAELTNPTERENMRLEIQKRLEEMLNGEKLAAVYFVDYVMQ
jgi:flagellar FliL protein